MSSYFEALNRRRRTSGAPAARVPVAVPVPPAPAVEAPVPPPTSTRAPSPSVSRPPDASAPVRGAVPPIYETLRERITLAADGRPLKTLVFAGCEGGEGCSRLVHEFAGSLAASGLDVLLIDADLRRARADAGVEAAGPDLAALVREQALPAEGGGAPGSLVVVPGATPADPESFLRSEELAGWLGRARTRFHYTLLDASPLLRHADGILASALCDGVVLVAKGGVTPGASLARARQLVERAGGRVVGVVLTDFHNPIPSVLRRFLDRG